MGTDSIRTRVLRRAGATALFGLLAAAAHAPALCLAENAFIDAHGDFFKLLRDDRTDMRFYGQYEPETEAEDSPGEVKVGTLGTNAELAYPLAPNLYMRFGGEYEYRHLKFERVRGAETELSSESLHTVAATVGAGVFLSQNLLLSGSAKPGAYSDFDRGFEEDDYRLEGEATLAFRFNPGALVIGGVEYSERYDDTPLLPLIGVRLVSEDGKIIFNALFPCEARLAYNFNPQAQIYFRASREGDQFRMSSGPREVDYDVYIARQWFGIGAELWITKTLALRPEAGVSAGNEFKMKRPEPGQFEGDLETGGYVQLQLGAVL